MLAHQIDFSQAMTEIYKPISGRVSDPDSLVVHGNPEGIRACEEYEAVVKGLQETLAPELEMIDSRIVQPARELLDVISAIRKTAIKRDHKKLDYDRHRATLKKLQDKKDKTAKDEKAMWKAENEVETSTQEFNYFNDLLKEELPKLFGLERDFIQPLFQSFYYMQLNIFYTLHERMQQVDIGYFNLTLDVEDAFHKKRGDVRERAEALSIVKFKTSGQKRPPKYGRPKPAAAIEGGHQPAGLLTAGSPDDDDDAQPAAAAAPPAVSSLRPSWKARQADHAAADHLNSPPPPYTPGPAAPLVGPGLKPKPASLAAAVAAKSKPPPPPKPKPTRLSATPKVETATALYDYAAQAEGDLSFRAGDAIEIVTRSANDQEWWSGRVGGKTGQFPGGFLSLSVSVYFSLFSSFLTTLAVRVFLRVFC